MENPDSRQASSGFEQLSFLPEPEFNPIWPNPNTNPGRCLAMMLNGKSFTHPEFQAVTGSWRLSQFVFILKGLGWPIASWDIPAPTTDDPGRTISRYYLPERVIKQVLGGSDGE